MKDQQLSQLRTFLSGPIFAQRKDSIRQTGFPLGIRTSDQLPWQITREEAEQVLHEFAPDLSLVIEGANMVIFSHQGQSPL